VVVAAERHPAERVDLVVAEVGGKAQAAGRDDIGRNGDNRGAGINGALCGLDRDPAPGIDRLRRRCQLHREALGERCEQRTKTLLAERGRVALGGLGKIERRHLSQVLGAIIRAKYEFDGGTPVAEIAWHHLLARNIGFARGIVDGAGDADLGGQEILEFAFARIAAADADLLALRRRIDVKPAPRRELGHRIAVGQIDPVRAAVEGHAEGLGVGDAASADMIGRFDQHIVPAGGGDAARGGDAGRAGADNDDVGLAGTRRSRTIGRDQGRLCRKGGRRGEERTPAETRHSFVRHGFQSAYGPLHIARTAHGEQTFRPSALAAP